MVARPVGVSPSSALKSLTRTLVMRSDAQLINQLVKRNIAKSRKLDQMFDSLYVGAFSFIGDTDQVMHLVFTDPLSY